MKKLCCVLLALLVTFSFGVVTYASTYKQDVTITLGREEEILEFLNSKRYDANNRYIFIIEDNKATKAICYNCGRPNLGIITKREEERGYSHGCPYNMMNIDKLTSYEVNEYERCTACDFENYIGLREMSYYVSCGSGGGTFTIKEEYTMEDGYDIHECLSTWYLVIP